MTTTGQQLVTLSGLLTGSALSHLLAISGGTGSGLIVNDGIDVTVEMDPYTVELQAMDVEAEVSTDPVVVEVADTSIEVEVVSVQVELELP